jgi:hypothetical protein
MGRMLSPENDTMHAGRSRRVVTFSTECFQMAFTVHLLDAAKVGGTATDERSPAGRE